jgi:hypothetical protein
MTACEFQGELIKGVGISEEIVRLLPEEESFSYIDNETAYMSWGKGRRQLLRFSKYGQPHLEELFSTHYVSPDLVAAAKARKAEAAAARPHIR